MFFILFYETVENYVERRAPFRQLHFDHLHRALDAGLLKRAGAFANPADGAALVFQTTDVEAVREFARTDPYVLNGVVNKWYIREWTVVVEG